MVQFWAPCLFTFSMDTKAALFLHIPMFFRTFASETTVSEMAVSKTND